MCGQLGGSNEIEFQFTAIWLQSVAVWLAVFRLLCACTVALLPRVRCHLCSMSGHLPIINVEKSNMVAMYANPGEKGGNASTPISRCLCNCTVSPRRIVTRIPIVSDAWEAELHTQSMTRFARCRLVNPRLGFTTQAEAKALRPTHESLPPLEPAHRSIVGRVVRG